LKGNISNNNKRGGGRFWKKDKIGGGKAQQVAWSGGCTFLKRSPGPYLNQERKRKTIPDKISGNGRFQPDSTRRSNIKGQQGAPVKFHCGRGGGGGEENFQNPGAGRYIKGVENTG